MQSDVEVSNCTFRGQYLYGILAVNNQSSETIKINDNFFDFAPQGLIYDVYVTRPIAFGSQNKHLEINDNVFQHQGMVNIPNSLPECRVITVDNAELNAYVSDQAEIAGNSFFFEMPDADSLPAGLGRAIEVNTLGQYDNFRIADNNVVEENALLDWGIWFNDQFGAGCEISHNTVEGTAPAPNSGEYNAIFGIMSLNSTSGLTMCDNHVDNTQYGLYFQGDNGQTDLRSNTMGKHGHGLLIENADNLGIQGAIGDQVRHGNTWSTDPNDYDAFAAQCDGNSGLSQFIVENQYLPGTAYFPDEDLINPQFWFLNQGTASDWCAPTPGPQSPPRLSDKDLETAGASGSFNGLSDAAKWEARRLLNDKLRRTPR